MSAQKDEKVNYRCAHDEMISDSHSCLQAFILDETAMSNYEHESVDNPSQSLPMVVVFCPFHAIHFSICTKKEKKKDIPSQSKVKLIVVYVEVGGFDFFS